MAASIEVAGGEDVLSGDVDELYRTLAKPLERIVRVLVHAPGPVIEDACQAAWTRLVKHRTRVRRDGVSAWLVKTAMHEALRLTRRDCREVSLDAEAEAGLLAPSPDPRPGPPDIYDQRERLRGLRALPDRQQRLLWLYGLGLRYEEIAARDGCSPRTVERQLQRARAQLRVDPAA